MYVNFLKDFSFDKSFIFQTYMFTLYSEDRDYDKQNYRCKF